MIPHLSPSLLSPPIWGLVFALVSASLLWLLSLLLKDVSIVDIFWGPGIAGVVDIVAWLGGAHGETASTALFLVNLWAVRLAAHIFTRHNGEDPRYGAMRKKHGERWWWLSFFQIFMLQAILIWFIPAPLVAAMLTSRGPMPALAIVGAAIAAFALVFEAIADFQLSKFRADPSNKGKVMDKGLWGWSRHPNYFGEATMWWGYFLIGFAASHLWWIILSPILVTTLLLKVSGVSLMEATIEDGKPGYADYKRRVSAFIPLPPKR